MIQTDGLALDPTDCKAPLLMDSIGPSVVTTNIAAAKVSFQGITRVDPASPDSSGLVQTGLIRLWGLNAIEPEYFAVQNQSIAVADERVVLPMSAPP